MASREESYLIGERYVPVILGNGLLGHLVAIGLQLEYAVSPILCGRRRNLLDVLNFKCGFLQLSTAEDHRLITEKLIDLADSLEDFCPLLIPVTEEGERFLSNHKDELESRYILTTRGFGCEGAFPLDRKKFQSPQKGEQK